MAAVEACRGGRRHLHHLRVRQVAAEPPAALAEGLGVGEDALDIGELGGARQEVVVDLERRLAADQELRVDQPVERVIHHALARVLDRHRPDVRPDALDLVEHLGDAANRHELRARPELPDRRQVRVGALGTEVREAERALETAGRRQDLGPDRADRPGGQRPGVQAGQLVEDLLLALGDEDRLTGLPLGAADLEGELRPLAEQPKELAVDLINTCSPFVQTHQISRRGA